MSLHKIVHSFPSTCFRKSLSFEIFSPNRYVVLIPRDGEEDGGGFWESLISSFASCDEGGGGGYQHKRIPPPIDSKLPNKEAEKIDALEKEKVDEIQPTKPFYYVLPPNSNRPISYQLGNAIDQPNNINSFYYRQLLPQSISIKPGGIVQGRVNSGA